MKRKVRDNLDRIVTDFLYDMADWKSYCLMNNLPENDESKKQWKRDRNLNNLLKMEDNIEIERRFLLKELPDVNYDYTIDITQYYIKIDEIWERYRKSVYSESVIKYYKTIKTFIRPGEQKEDEIEISEVEYNNAVDKCNSGDYKARVIEKKRYVHKMSDGLKWEIDKFEMNVVIAEIELPELRHKFETPDWLDNEIILEVTEHKEFSSKSLATVL